MQNNIYIVAELEKSFRLKEESEKAKQLVKDKKWGKEERRGEGVSQPNHSPSIKPFPSSLKFITFQSSIWLLVNILQN